MRRVLLSLMLAAGLSANAQTFNVTTASLSITKYQGTTNVEEKIAAIREGKEAIDKAYINPETQSNAKMWYNRQVIYIILATDPLLGMNDSNAAEIALEATIRCIKTDNDKKKFSDPAKLNIGTVAQLLNYNAGLAYNAKRYERAFYYYKKVLELEPYDTGKQMDKSNVSVTETLYYAALSAKAGGLSSNNKALKMEAATYFQLSIDKGYNSPLTYEGLATLYLEEGDTAKALSYVEKGRDNFPGSSELIRIEINTYIAQQRVDILIQKLNVAIENNPNSELFFYIRGNSYQILADNEDKKIKQMEDSISYYQKMARLSADPKKKASLQSRQNDFKAKQNKAITDKSNFLMHCEEDYKKALEIKEDMMDVHYGLGVFYINSADVYTNQMNSLPYSAEKEYAAAKEKQDALYKKAIVHFEKALALVKEDKNAEEAVLSALYKVYSALGNMEKSLEYKKKHEELQNKMKKEGRN